MPTAIKMPALGQTSDELRLIEWFKVEGEQVAEGEPLFEAETDKTTLEVEAASSGTLLRVLCAPGESVAAGTVVAWLGEAGEAVPDADPTPPGEGADSAPPRLRATPAARMLAREHGVDLAALTGSGAGGQIERRDVLEAIATEPAQEGEAVPRHRQAIANRLERATRVPQFTLSRSIDARLALERAAPIPGATVTHVLLRAVGAALRSSPQVNRVWVDGPRYKVLESCSVGLAVAVEDNLIVPSIADPDQLSLEEVASTVRRAVDEARAGRLSAAFAAPAAVTISNLGMFGVDRFEAIVDPDQTAILAVGRVSERPAVTPQGISAIPQIDLTLTVDHRTVDGAGAARFLEAICAQLED